MTHTLTVPRGHDRPVGGAGVDRDPAAPLTPSISVALRVGLGRGGGATLVFHQ